MSSFLRYTEGIGIYVWSPRHVVHSHTYKYLGSQIFMKENKKWNWIYMTFYLLIRIYFEWWMNKNLMLNCFGTLFNSNMVLKEQPFTLQNAHCYDYRIKVQYDNYVQCKRLKLISFLWWISLSCHLMKRK